MEGLFHTEVSVIDKVISHFSRWMADKNSFKLSNLHPRHSVLSHGWKICLSLFEDMMEVIITGWKVIFTACIITG